MNNLRQEYLIQHIEKFKKISNDEKKEAIYKTIFTTVFAGLTIYGYQNIFPIDNAEEYLREIIAILISAELTIGGLLSTVFSIVKHLKLQEHINEAELELKMLRMKERYQATLEKRGRQR